MSALFNRTSFIILTFVSTLLLSACGTVQKKISLDDKPKFDRSGYIAAVVSISSEYLHPRIPYWQEMIITSTSESDEKIYVLKAKQDIDSTSKLYLGQLPPGQYQARSLHSFYSDNNISINLIQPLDAQALTFNITAGQIANLQGIAFHDTTIFINENNSFWQLFNPNRSQNNLTLIKRYASDAPARWLQQSIGQTFAVDNLPINDALTLKEYQRALNLIPHLETSVILDQHTASAEGAILGNFGSMVFKSNDGDWIHLHAPTLQSLTAAEKLDSQRYMVATEFGQTYIYSAGSGEWTPAGLDTGSRIALIDAVNDSTSLIVQSQGDGYQAVLFDHDSGQQREVTGIDVKRDINYTLEFSRRKAFRLQADDQQPLYFILDGFYRLDTDNAQLVPQDGDAFLYATQQGNDVLSGRPESFFTYRFGASYDHGKSWENALKGTKIDDFLERRAYIARNKYLLKPVPILDTSTNAPYIRETEFYVSGNLAGSWEQVSVLEGDCSKILYGLSDDEQIYIYCIPGIIYATRDFGRTWQESYRFKPMRPGAAQ